MLNIVLGDSLLNLFRDHNFDSCAVCVCSDGQNCVGTIRGPDAVFYLPESSRSGSLGDSGAATGAARAITTAATGPGGGYSGGMGPGPGSVFMSAPADEESCRCNCGFSAVVNRRLSHQAGLFYEDEAEIAGAASTTDPAQFRRASLFAVCHSDKEPERLALNRSRVLDFARTVCSADKRTISVKRSVKAHPSLLTRPLLCPRPIFGSSLVHEWPVSGRAQGCVC